MEAKKMGFTHDNKDNKTVDWWTPLWVFEALGLEFDLDPCAPVGGVPWIPAKSHYSIQDDGLNRAWHGAVWLNPPYGKFTSSWLEKMHIHRNGVALVFARTDCKWFHDYVANADAILLMKGRVSFVDGLGLTASGGAGCGSMLISWGVDSTQALLKCGIEGMFINKSEQINQDAVQERLFT